MTEKVGMSEEEAERLFGKDGVALIDAYVALNPGYNGYGNVVMNPNRLARAAGLSKRRVKELIRLFVAAGYLKPGGDL